MQTHCLDCGKPFDKTREGKKFCNSTCRSRYNTKKMSGLSGLQPPLFPMENKTPKAEFHSWPNGNGGNFQAFLQQENNRLVAKLEAATTELETLRQENSELRINEKINTKLAELNVKENDFNKENTLGAVTDKVLNSDITNRLADGLLTFMEKKFSGGADDGILQGLEGTHKEHIETLLNVLRNNESLTEQITALTFFVKDNPDLLAEIIDYLKNPDQAETPANPPAEKEESANKFGTGIF